MQSVSNLCFDNLYMGLVKLIGIRTDKYSTSNPEIYNPLQTNFALENRKGLVWQDTAPCEELSLDFVETHWVAFVFMFLYENNT